jgi:hypothetical protein
MTPSGTDEGAAAMNGPEGPDRATRPEAPGSGPGTDAPHAPASGAAARDGGAAVPAVPRQGALPTTEPGHAAESGAEEPAEALSGTIAELTADNLDQSERRRLLGRLAGEIRARGIGDLFRPRAAMRWIADLVGDVAPRLPIRDRDTLRRHFPGLPDDVIAERLIRNAALTTAAVGAASGGVAAIEWVATPTLLSAPVLLAAETVAVVAVEIKLIGELHELYDIPIRGSASQRAVALVQSWAHRRGLNPLVPGMGVAAVLGATARKQLRDRLLRRFGRNLTSYGPLLTGAAVASYLNRRATQSLGHEIRRDLVGRRNRPQISQWPTQPGPDPR